MTELLKNDKYEIKCVSADANLVKLEIEVFKEKLTEKEIAALLKTIRKILYAFDRSEGVSSRFGNLERKGK